MRKVAVAVFGCLILVTLAAGQGFAQQAAAKTNPELEKLNTEFSAAWGKGDIQGLGSRYAPDAVRVGADGAVQQGREAIQKYFAGMLGGTAKGSAITLRTLGSTALSADVMVVHGTYEVTGPGARSGHFLNTMSRRNGTWLIASSATVPNQPAAR